MSTDPDEVYSVLESLDAYGYPVGLATAGTSDSNTNHCGIAESHAYSVIAPFNISMRLGIVKKLVLVRNPWGTTNYDQSWYSRDPKWTDDTVAQVPYGIDPRVDSEKHGYFVVPVEYLTNTADIAPCFSYLDVAYDDSDSGYAVTSWYDVEDSAETIHNFKMDVPENKGHIAVTVESYGYQTIPNDCFPMNYYYNSTGSRFMTADAPYFELTASN